MSPRRRPGLLARVDARVVPALSAAVRRVGRGVATLGRATGPVGRWLARLSRRNPTITTAVAAVVAAAVLIVTTGGDHHEPVAPAPPEPAVVLPGNALGPTAGQPVSAYLDAVSGRTSDLQTSHASSVTAVVDFKGYLTAAAAESVLAGLPQIQVTQAFAETAPPAVGVVHAIALSPQTDLGVELTQLQAAAHQTVVAYRAHVLLAQQHPTAANQNTVASYADLAGQARVDQTGIGADVGCVFALAVAGPAAQLRTLATRSDVRVLDPAPPTVATADLRIVPLEPQTIDTVPVLTFGSQY